MTVAAFLRDAKTRGALNGNAAEAGALVTAFFAQYDYGDCTPQQLLALTDAAMRGQNEPVARAALERVIASGTLLHLALYRQGRLEFSARDVAAAEARFTAGTIADAAFAYNWMGLARALQAQGRTADAVAAAARFVRFGVRPHAREDITVLAELADHLFDAKDATQARNFYALLVSLGAERPRDAMRLAQMLLDAGEAGAAVDLLKTQSAKRPLDAAGRALMAACESRLSPAQIDLGPTVVRLPVKAAGPVNRTAILDGFQRAPDPAAILAAIADHATILGPLGIAELRVRLLRATDDLAGAVALLVEQAFAYQSRLYYLAMETGYVCVQADRLDLVLRLADRLTLLAPTEIGIKVLRIDAYFRAKLWEQAGPVFASMSDTDHARPNVVLKYFEFNYFTGDLETAERLFQVLDKMVRPSRQYMLPMLRFLAEKQDWDGVVDRAAAWLAGDFVYAQVGYVLFRAARYTRRHADLMSAIEAIGGWADQSDLCRLRSILLLDRADSVAALDALAADATVAGNDNFLQQLDARRAVLAGIQGSTRRQAVFLCADRAFLCGMIVTLHNMTGLADLGATDFYLVVDDEDVVMARGFTARFGSDGVSLQVVPASDIVDAGAALDAVYGIFNSGQILSQAAYYRIYFARYLQRLGRHDRAVYVDGDVLARGRLDALFGMDLNGHAVAARLEKPRPEVLRAAALHDLPNGRFFNSGVLLFDLRHPGLADALDRAIDASTDPSVKLIYHDQCALNRAFRGEFLDLDPIWNFPMTERTPPEEVPAEAVILHFLDRPKPWSAAHGGAAAAIWWQQWRHTAAYLGEAAAIELFALLKD